MDVLMPGERVRVVFVGARSTLAPDALGRVDRVRALRPDGAIELESVGLLDPEHDGWARVAD